MPIIAAPLEAMAVLGPSHAFLPESEADLGAHPGFVLIGIPIYYITQRSGPGSKDPPLFIGESTRLPVAEFEADTCYPKALCSDCFARVRGRPSLGTGWQAVATDGDEHLEMSEQHSR